MVFASAAQVNEIDLEDEGHGDVVCRDATSSAEIRNEVLVLIILEGAIIILVGLVEEANEFFEGI